MTQFNPHLEIKQLRVLAGDHIAYEAQFHKGLNIIRGENSSGKSTILDFLFLGLGGDLTDWREASQKCSKVVLEVLLNDRLVTLSREVEKQKFRPMEIYIGSLANALKAPKTEWKTYPYARQAQKESFSQIIFRWLGIPEVAGEAEGKITMHQILRLLYADQMTPIENIFRFEERDSPLIRQTVGDLLCGAYDYELYSAQIRRIEANREFDDAKAELASILDVIGSAGHALTLSWIASARKKVLDEINQIQTQIEELEEKIFHGEVSDGLSQEEQKETYIELVKTQTQLAAAQKKKDDLELEAADSAHYIASLQAKLESVNDASLTVSALQKIAFMYCPSCLAPLDENTIHHACSLCKSPFGEENAKSRVLGLINDISQQIKQSNYLQKERAEELKILEKKLVQLNAQWESANRRYQLANRTPSTELRTNAKNLHRKAGALEQELISLSEKEVLIKRVDELSQRKEKLQGEITKLADFIAARQREQENYISKAYTTISDNTCNILRMDLDRQSTFKDAEYVKFSFGDNKLSVNGESFFSASSMVFLRNSFMLSFLQTSLQNPKFRHPRFLIMDTIEDKGMEPARSHNFQMIMKKISESSQTEHQLIYATSMIAPELEGTDYVVGRTYTHDNRTLHFKAN